MRPHIIFKFIFFLIIFSCHSYAITVQKLVEWPPLPDDGIAADTADRLVFHSLGDIIKIYNSENLSPKSSFKIETKKGIFAVYTDEENNKLYCGAGVSGIFIIDYNNPANPSIVSTITNVEKDPGFLQGTQRGFINAVSLVVNYPYLYVADSGYGLRIFNILDPLNPVYEGGYREDGQSEKLTTGGYFDIDYFTHNSKDYACVLDTYYGLRIFDVTNPSDYDNPINQENNSIDEPDKDEIEKPDLTIPQKGDPDPVAQKDLRNSFYNSIALVRDLKARLLNGSWHILLTSRSSTQEKAAVAKLKLFDDLGNLLSTPINKGRCSDLLKGNSVEEKNYAFIADGDNGLNVVDINNPSSTNDQGVEIYDVKASLNSGFNYSYALKILENKIFIADFIKGITSIDITSPLNPIEERSSGEVIKITDIAKLNQTISASNTSKDDYGIYFFNVETPSEPKLIKRLETTSKPIGVEPLTDTIAAITENKILIFSNIETDPTVVNKLSVGQIVTDFVTKNNYLFTVSGTRFNIYSYTKTGVTFIKTFSSEKVINCVNIDSSNNTLMAGTLDSILFYDITEPANTELKGEHVLSENVSDLFSNLNILYASTGTYIYTFDITDINNIFNINTINAELAVNTLFADEDFLFAGVNIGVKIYSKTNKSSPDFLFTHSTQGSVLKIILKNSHIYSADSSGGISISEYDKDAGSNPAPLETSSGTSSACFIKSIF